jgi:hypothetical protein
MGVQGELPQELPVLRHDPNVLVGDVELDWGIDERPPDTDAEELGVVAQRHVAAALDPVTFAYLEN